MISSYAISHSATTAAVIIALATSACGPAAMGRPRPHPDNPLPSGVVADADQFRKTLGAVAPGNGNTRQRKSTKCVLWVFSCDPLDVTIVAIGNTLAVDPDKPPPAGTGFPVAKLTNNDPEKKVEKYYRLKHDSEAEYYLWVSAKNSRETQWTLIEVPRGSGRVIAAEATDLRVCHKRLPGEPMRSEADFASYRKGGHCTERYATTATTDATVEASSGFSIQPFLAVLHNLLVLRWAVAEGGWIDCTNGCCT